MKHFFPVAALAASILVFASCKKDNAAPDSISTGDTAKKEIEIQEPIETGSQGSVGLGGCLDFYDPFFWTVCLTDISEYRCPCDVQCFWIGSVDYTLHVTGPDIDSVFTLQPPGNPLGAPSSIKMGGFKLEIEEISPTTCAGYGDYENYKLQVTLSY